MLDLRPYSPTGQAIGKMFLDNAGDIQIINGEMFIYCKGWIWLWNNMHQMKSVADVEQVLTDLKMRVNGLLHLDHTQHMNVECKAPMGIIADEIDWENPIEYQLAQFTKWMVIRR